MRTQLLQFLGITALLGGLVSCSLLHPVLSPIPVEPSPPTLPRTILRPPSDRMLADIALEEELFPRTAWTDSVLATLDWRRTVAQLLFPFSYSDRSAKTLGRIRGMTQEYGVGGVILSRGTVPDARRLIMDAQRWSEVPMLIAADFEHGPGMRLDGGLVLPSMMAMAATRQMDLVYRAGVAVGQASRAIGVTMNFAPVADVNSNPRNPIINTRAFGEEPGLVADMAEAYMRGLQDGGMLATAKHFPGHGDTHVDSHTGLPLIDASRARLDSIELHPFGRLIEAGVRAVMSGHLAVPALTGDSSLPATLSAAVMDTLLRRQLGFRGLVVTDAMNMKALTRTNIGNLPAAALRAGADVLLIPGELSETIDSISAAVTRGELDSARVRRSARRILDAKHALGLAVLGHSQDMAADSSANDSLACAASHCATEIAEHALTMVRNTGALLPLRDSTRITVVSLVRKGMPKAAREFVTRLRSRFPHVRAIAVERRAPRDPAPIVRDSLRDADVVLIAAHISVVNGAGSIGLSEQQRLLLDQVADTRLPRVMLSLGTPYVLEAVPTADAMLCAYGDDPASIDAVVRVLAGEISPRGRLPVSIPGIARYGEGMEYPHATNATVPVVPEIDGSASASPRFAVAFQRVDSLIQDQILRKSTPGAQLAIVRGDTVLYIRNYGHVAYDSGATVVDEHTRYDLASLTKVVVTTTAAMQLVERGRLHLDSTVASYVPAFGVRGKQHITIRNLLTHRSGLEAFRPFHQLRVDSAAVLDSILAAPLVYDPGSRTVYSDFNMIVLGRVIEQVTGMSLDAYARRHILAPLGMISSDFRPSDSLRAYCAPTEYDHHWRRRLVQGSVHDETADLLGGVAGHAGLFSTASDLARFARMLLGRGVLEGRRIVDAATISLFTSRQSTRGTRGLGWDLRSATGSSAGRYFSMHSFGHTGFTGTSIWVDPTARIAVVFLTNRVHPTRENKQLPRFRATLHDAIREALATME